MRGPLAACPEVVARGHEPPAEMVLPDAIDHDPRGERILGTGDPARQLEPAAARLVGVDRAPSRPAPAEAIGRADLQKPRGTTLPRVKRLPRRWTRRLRGSRFLGAITMIGATPLPCGTGNSHHIVALRFSSWNGSVLRKMPAKA